jgi:hypothetical protein
MRKEITWSKFNMSENDRGDKVKREKGEGKRKELFRVSGSGYERAAAAQ